MFVLATQTCNSALGAFTGIAGNVEYIFGVNQYDAYIPVQNETRRRVHYMYILSYNRKINVREKAMIKVGVTLISLVNVLVLGSKYFIYFGN